jgi:DNA-binding HxlR family transcriptional regulator
LLPPRPERPNELYGVFSYPGLVAEGFVRLLYPDKPRHPRQKYLLTVKGSALYNFLTKDASWLKLEIGAY